MLPTVVEQIERFIYPPTYYSVGVRNMKYENINTEILRQLTSQIGNPNVLNKTLEIIKTIQIESKSIFKGTWQEAGRLP